MVDRPDEDLVRATVCGDVDGFMELCRRYYPTMVAIARAILGDSHLAEDAAQEAFAKACRKLPGLNEPARFGPWLATICRNQARDMVRRTPRMESLGDRDIPVDVPQQSADVEGVRRAVESLRPESREVLYLKYRGDLSHKQMSDVLGILFLGGGGVLLLHEVMNLAGKFNSPRSSHSPDLHPSKTKNMV